MTAPSEATPDLDDLTRRVPGQALMAECIRHQAARHPRGRIARVLGVHAVAPDARSWYVGALGERITARLLDALGPEYVVLHSVPVSESGTDIDHLVVGPIGVVAINTKHLRDARVWVAGDTVMVNGHREPFVRVARSERRRVVRTMAQRTLPVTPVTSIVAVVDPASVAIRSAPEDVLVLDARRLVRTLRRMPEVLGHDAVWALAGALSSGSTWIDHAAPEDEGVVPRFAAIEREARIARIVRLAWAGGGCAALAGGAVLAVAAIPGLMAMVTAVTGS
ncbi:nuclease-related domain-containing protein [Curtobacterium sp. Leaf261]|uniref:nuclease-related domain-containing protein n=1 Tax=Curtobacterium sp. Leaf261 TaxID=1736311 RepID=UPI000AD1DAD2|nr:nuclease-related domain-containing protein [Curtobacterium sp. Leaf261]